MQCFWKRMCWITRFFELYFCLSLYAMFDQLCLFRAENKTVVRYWKCAYTSIKISFHMAQGRGCRRGVGGWGWEEGSKDSWQRDSLAALKTVHSWLWALPLSFTNCMKAYWSSLLGNLSEAFYEPSSTFSVSTKPLTINSSSIKENKNHLA